MNSIDKDLNFGHGNDTLEKSDSTIGSCRTLFLNSQLSTLNSDDDKVVFVPAEEIRAIESIYVKMEQAQQEFRKVAEELRNNGWQ